MTDIISLKEIYLVLWQTANLLLLFYCLKKEASSFLYAIDFLSQGFFFSMLLLEGGSYYEIATYLSLDVLLVFLLTSWKKKHYEL